jgi:release factor glutamine methyltransferase
MTPTATRRAATPLTAGKLLDEGERRLKKLDVEHPDASAVWLLAFVLGMLEDVDAVERRRSRRVSAADAARFRELVERRASNEPFAYIVGVTDFRGKLMEIEQGVFVPREQTERMCDEIEAWALERGTPRDGWRIADVGTGSGAMAISLALGPMKPRRVFAVDISDRALALVRRNARRHGVGRVVRPMVGDWLSTFPAEPCLDVVCSVPPYLNPGDEVYVSDESMQWEPTDAFFGEPSGDSVLRTILDQAGPRLRPGGLVALQADSDQIPGLVDYVNEDPDHPLTIEWILHDGGDEDAVLAVKR